MLRKRVLVGLASAVTALLVMAAPAAATESISSLSSTLSSSAAGAHPDIRTSFSMADPAGSEVPREVELQMPEGIFGNPGAATLCKASQFGRNECEPGSQVGVITIRADYEGNAEHLMGTAPSTAWNRAPPTRPHCSPSSCRPSKSRSRSR